MGNVSLDSNLFTDLHHLREKVFGTDCEQEVKDVRTSVKEDIEMDCRPANLRYLLFKTTNYCNSDCMYCSHAINRVPREEKFSVPTDIIMRTIDEAAELGVYAISVSGGEPTIRKDIEAVISRMVEKKIIPVLLTNGLLLDEKWESLGEAGLRYVIISFDSATPEIYEKQRGADFGKAVKGIDAAIKLRERYPETEIHVSAVLTKDNQDDFFKLLEYMNERKIKVQISPYHVRTNDKEDYSIVEYEKIKRISEELVEKKLNGWYIANSIDFIRNLPNFFCGDSVMPKDFRCKIGYTNLAIDTYMNVRPCWSFMYENLGNLRDKSLIEIWNSDKMQQYRKAMLDCKCEGCWYLCTSEVSIMLDNLFM